ncbi:uncharacterized protein LOC128196629 [Vigna angularis]|uniref:uncharacterized protein LOC128196629 n=1 Tax=Phaseolus angularis TaxID=3914 RepID=UPI0022B3A3BA|nr:uncharacterized protein LOC128196629 [Vigna angularis]
MPNCDVEVVFHHGGKFVNDGSFKYEFGQTSTLKIDPDRWSYFEIMSILKEMGYINVKELWYSVGGGTVLEGRLELLSDDKGACDLVNLAILNGQSHLYVVHMVSDPEYVHMLGEGDTDNRVEVECEEECEKAGNDNCVEAEAEGDTDGAVLGEGVEADNDNIVEAEVVGEDVGAGLGEGVEAVNDNFVEAEAEGEDVGAVLGEGVEADSDNFVDAEAEGEDVGAVLGEGVEADSDNFVEAEAEREDGGHDDYDVRSWNGDEEDVLSEDHLVEVSVHGDEVEDDFCNRSEEVEVGGPSGKYLMKRWARNREKISWSGFKLFEVRHTSNIGDKFVVDIDKVDCSCRKWSITGIPCCHALTAMTFLNINGEDYISHWFTKSTYEQTYFPMIYPVNSAHIWEMTSMPDVLPPPKRILPGRPKKKRRLEPWELKKDDTQLRQGGTHKRCGICRELGHKRNTCPQAAQAAPTTPNATQSSQITQCEVEQPQQSHPSTTAPQTTSTPADPTATAP